MIVGQVLALVAHDHMSQSVRWEVGQGWGVCTRGSSRGKSPRWGQETGVKAVRNVTLDN